MLGELETRDLEVIRPGGRVHRRTALFHVEPFAGAATAALAGLALLSIAVRIGLSHGVRGPFVFMDELGYEQLARSFARTGHFALYSKAGLAYSPLYPIVLSPIYALTDSAATAYRWVQVVNSVLMSLSVFPVYGIARFVLSRRLALGVAALSATAPLMFYSALELTENLAYPLVLVAIWAMLRALDDPSPRNDAVLLGAILLACAARLQAIVLFPSAMTAIALAAVVRPDLPGQGRARSLRRALGRHRLLLGAVGVALVAVLIRTIANGGALPLAGSYSVVGEARPPLSRLLEISVQHLAGLDLAVGVVPFAGALLAAYLLARSRFPRNGLLFGAVAAATTFWLLLEVGFDSAAFDTGRPLGPARQVGGELPRIHERYLIYLVPLFLVALVAAARRAHAKVPRSIHLLIGAAVTLLPAAIPFSRDINHTIVADSFGLQIFGDTVNGTIVPVDHPVPKAIVLAGAFAAAYLLAFLDARHAFALVATVVAFLFLSTLVFGREMGAAKGSTVRNLPARWNWVDRAARGHGVVLVGGSGVRRVALLETAFNNLALTRLYYLCRPAFDPAFGERSVAVDATGRLHDGAGPIHARYAVVPTAFDVIGRVLARDARAGLELVAPAGGVITVPAQRRAALDCRR